MKLGSALVLAGLSLGSSLAWADSVEPASNPSVFTYAGRGFLVGGMVGLSGGYLAARRDGWESGDWQAFAYGAGIGALTGGALGLTLGILDTSRNTPGYGSLILRDTVYGAGFGAVAGGIVGGLIAISSRDALDIPLGASVGTMVGAVAGVVFGVIEGNRALDRTSPQQRTQRFGVSVALATAADGQPTWLPTFTGRY